MICADLALKPWLVSLNYYSIFMAITQDVKPWFEVDSQRMVFINHGYFLH